MALPAQDTFTRANGTLGSNWSETGGTGTGGTATKLTSNAATPNGATGNAGGASYWNADSFPNDQYSQGNVSGYMAPLIFIGPACRINTGTATTWGSYCLKISNSSNGVNLVYVLNGNFYSMAYVGSIAANDLLRVQAVGTTISAKKNGAAFGNSSTSNTWASGRAGIMAYGVGTSYWLDNFEGGAIGAAPISGTGAVSLRRLTASAAGTRWPVGAVAAALKRLSIAIAGKQGEKGTVAVQLKHPTATVSGQQGEVGAGAVTLKHPTASASGHLLVVGTAAPNLSRAAVTAAGWIEVTGPMSAGLRAGRAQAEGRYLSRSWGDVAVTLPSMLPDVDGSYSVLVDGTGSVIAVLQKSGKVEVLQEAHGETELVVSGVGLVE